MSMNPSVIDGTMTEAVRCANTRRPLTHLIDSTERQAAVKATQCSVDGCEKPPKTLKHGLCAMHHSRQQRTGTTALRAYDVQAAVARFWSKVEVRGEAECWPFKGTVLRNGYGQFTVQGKAYEAHRFSYEISVGPIPKGLTIDHVKARGCTLHNCVNPSHLEPVTIQENLRRSDCVSAVNSRKVACPKCGADYTGIDSRGDRFCRPCKAAWTRAYKKRRAS